MGSCILGGSVEKLRTWFLNKLLSRDELIAVPESWQTEFVQLAGDKVRNGQVIAEIIKEYNKLLEDYLNKCSIKELKDMLKDAGVERIPTDAGKDGLVSMAYQEYKMRKEK